MSSAIQTAAAGLAAAGNRFDRAARDMAAGGPSVAASAGPATRLDLSASAVEAMQAQIDVQANAALMRSADALQKRLLDIVA